MNLELSFTTRKKVENLRALTNSHSRKFENVELLSKDSMYFRNIQRDIKELEYKIEKMEELILKEPKILWRNCY